MLPRRCGLVSNDFNHLLNAGVGSGTPMRVIVDSSDGKYLTAYGSGLVQGASGEELQFFVTGTASTSLLLTDFFRLLLMVCSSVPTLALLGNGGRVQNRAFQFAIRIDSIRYANRFVL